MIGSFAVENQLFAHVAKRKKLDLQYLVCQLKKFGKVGNIILRDAKQIFQNTELGVVGNAMRHFLKILQEIGMH